MEGPERKIFKEIMAKKFPNTSEHYNLTDLRSPSKSSLGNMKRITARHITIKLLKVGNKEKTVKSTRGGKNAVHEDKDDIRFLTGILQAKKKKEDL